VAIAPDGTWLASSDSGTVRIWDTATGQLRATLEGHADRVRAVAIAPDGTWLASSDGRAVRIWDMPTARLRTVNRGRSGRWVFALNGIWFVSSSRNEYNEVTVRVWDIATGQPWTTLIGAAGAESAVAIAPDGTWLAGSDGGTVQIWDTASAYHRATLTGHDGWVAALAIAPDGTWLASGGGGTVQIWDAITGKQRASLSGHDGQVMAVAIAPGGNWLASSTDDGSAHIWDITSGLKIAVMRVGHGLESCAWDPSGQLLAAAGRGGLYLFTFNNPAAAK
jgi:WD40 repeat protein